MNVMISLSGELARQLGHCEAKGVFTMVSMVGTVKEALKQDQDVAKNVKVSAWLEHNCTPN